MKKGLKHSVLLFALALMLSVLFMPAQADAATKNYMKKQNVTWDLKKGKVLQLKTYYAGVGFVNDKAKVTKYKVTKSSIPGYKKLTMTVKFYNTWKPTREQVDKMVNSEFCRKTTYVGGVPWVHVIDYNTGRSLWKDSRFLVKSEWTNSNAKNYFGSGTRYVILRAQVCKLTVQYPKNYKGLCIGISGSTSVNDARDEAFTNGKIPFGKSRCVSKKYKKVAHFKRVTK